MGRCSIQKNPGLIIGISASLQSSAHKNVTRHVQFGYIKIKNIKKQLRELAEPRLTAVTAPLLVKSS